MADAFLTEVARDPDLTPEFKHALMCLMSGDDAPLRRYYKMEPQGTCTDCGDRKPVHRWGLSERDDLICTACDTIRRDDLADRYKVLAEKHCWKCGQTPSEAEHAWRMHGMLCNHCSPSQERSFDVSGAADYERGVGR